MKDSNMSPLDGNQNIIKIICEVGGAIIAIIAGIIVIFKDRECISSIWNKYSSQPLQNCILAVSISAGKARESFAENNASQIFSDAGVGSHWSGIDKKWRFKKDEMKLEKISFLPENNDEKIILTYALKLPNIPDDYISIRRVLKQAEKEGNLPKPAIWRFTGEYVSPSRFGFK